MKAECPLCEAVHELTAADQGIVQAYKIRGQDAEILCEDCTQREVEEMRRLEARDEAEWGE